ncbi:MAG: hypothetical protein IPM07_25370 [Anaerolineales bacterium]|nr:hypothetical protein [Anaerolineales bacterium]
MNAIAWTAAQAVTRPIPDWVNLDGKRCDKCANHEYFQIPDGWKIQRCTLHMRACVVTRGLMGRCGPTAKDWRRA